MNIAGETTALAEGRRLVIAFGVPSGMASTSRENRASRNRDPVAFSAWLKPCPYNS